MRERPLSMEQFLPVLGTRQPAQLAVKIEWEDACQLTPISKSTMAAGYAAALRAELCERAQRFAEAHRLPSVHSYGSQPVVVFPPYRRTDGTCDPCPEGDLHGNFLDVTYRAVRANDNWRRRLEKVHTQGRSSLPRGDRGKWRELDTCTSSDALLMNVFAYPALWRDGRVAGLLGGEGSARPTFGDRKRTRLNSRHIPLSR